MKILIYGFGNPGRQDDGLGIFFAEELEAWAAGEKLEGLTFDSNYQLNAEDALMLKENDIVIFSDAAAKQEEPYKFRQIQAGDKISFSTHSMSPESLLAFCWEMYSKKPLTFIMSIKAKEWDINGELTNEARANMNMALEFIKPMLKTPYLFTTPNN